MEKIKELLARPLVTAALGFVLGLIIGLPLLGWGLWPVKWTEAAPEHLRQDVKEDYMRMAVQSYSLNKDGGLAAKRYQELGADGDKVFAKVSTDPALNPADVIAFGGAVKASPSSGAPSAPTSAAGAGATQPAGATQAAQGVAPTIQATGAAGAMAVTPAASGEQGSTSSPFLLLAVFCLLTLIIGAALLYILVFRKRGFPGRKPAAGQQVSSAGPVARSDVDQEGQETPIAHFMTTYVLGDDLYDDSFSIDSPTGEFLGECGVGISDTIGVGDPKKVTAFELWLFDKNDIQTVTKVLMSEHAFTDANTRQRLVSKGEPVMVKPNEHVLLETATLTLEARVVEMAYGSGALPTNSFYERMTLELAVWPK
jgi:hypothetical protein